MGREEVARTCLTYPLSLDCPQALGVGPTTEGTSQRRSDYAYEAPVVEALKKAQKNARDPQRRAKVAAAMRGRKRSSHVIEAMRRGRLGEPHPKKVRQKMSEAHKRRGTWPPIAGRPWTPKEDELVQVLPAIEVAKRTGRSEQAVFNRRTKLRLQ